MSHEDLTQAFYTLNSKFEHLTKVGGYLDGAAIQQDAEIDSVIKIQKMWRVKLAERKRAQREPTLKRLTSLKRSATGTLLSTNDLL